MEEVEEEIPADPPPIIAGPAQLLPGVLAALAAPFGGAAALAAPFVGAEAAAEAEVPLPAAAAAAVPEPPPVLQHNHLEEKLLDVSKRLARELAEARRCLEDERERLEKELELERTRLTAELELREERIQVEQESITFDRVRIEALVTAPEDEVLNLNVGGQMFTTRRSTLGSVEGSYLGNLFSGRWEGSIERDVHGNHFLDFDPVCFRQVLNFLRSKKMENALQPAFAPAPPAQREEQLRNLVEYLGLTEAFRQAQSLDAAVKAQKGGSSAAPSSSGSRGWPWRWT